MKKFCEMCVLLFFVLTFVLVLRILLKEIVLFDEFSRFMQISIKPLNTWCPINGHTSLNKPAAES